RRRAGRTRRAAPRRPVRAAPAAHRRGPHLRHQAPRRRRPRGRARGGAAGLDQRRGRRAQRPRARAGVGSGPRPRRAHRAGAARRRAHPVRHARAAGLVPAARPGGCGAAVTVIPFPAPAVLAPAAFDVCGPLPTGTTVLEASAGTGKTFTIAALAARYVAEGHATLPELMLVTFGREATQELRERVRERLVTAERGLADPAAARAGSDDVLRLLADAPDAEVAARRARLARALAQFDAATIATTHQFCQQMLAGLGVAGDGDRDAVFAESIDDVITEVV